jgi:hypothetical protein
MTHLDQWSDPLWIWRPRSFPWTIPVAHYSTDTFPFFMALLPYDHGPWLWAQIPGASWFCISWLHVVLHAQTSESQNHDFSDQVPYIPTGLDNPDEYRHFGTSALWDSGNLRTPYFCFPKMTFSMVRIWCQESCWIEWLLSILGFRDLSLLQTTSIMFRTLDSRIYNFSSISEIQNEISSFKLNLLSRLIQVHIKMLQVIHVCLWLRPL